MTEFRNPFNKTNPLEAMRDARAIRQELVPDFYTGCPHREVIFYNESVRDYSIKCHHPDFRKENGSECLGQCAIAGFPYGIPEDQLPVVDGMHRSPFFGW